MMEVKYTLLANGSVRRDSNGEIWCIPADQANTDYKQYLAWVAKGNKPETLENIKE